jgi:hypothetical protein
MPKDYQRKSATRNSPAGAEQTQSSRPAFFSGLIIGALCMHFVPMLFEDGELNIKALPSAERISSSPDIIFTFQDILRGSKIVIPKDELVIDNTVVPEKNTTYLLQVGSFKNKADAEGLRVQLLLLNLTASIKPYEAASGDRWHRVLVGPFANNSKMASAQAKLAENRINSLLIKNKI